MIALNDFAIATMMAWTLVITGLVLVFVSIYCIYWMRVAREQEEYIDQLRQRLRPYEQPGFRTIPDVEVYNPRTREYEPLRAP